MSRKNKLQKFDDMAGYPHVFQYAFEQLQAAPFPLKGRWRSDFFGNDGPIVVELGCGRGEYTVGLARRYPQKNFIGMDIKGARMWTGATESLEAGLHNVAFLRTHIELIEYFFAPGEVDELWITFADPQMKRCNKRLTSTAFLRRYQQVMAPGGLIHLKSDSNFLVTYTEAVVRANGLPIVAHTRNLYGDDTFAPAETLCALRDIRTGYETQWLARGLDIKYLCCRFEPRDEWIEPQVEIPLDSYRSYGRVGRTPLATHT